MYASRVTRRVPTHADVMLRAAYTTVTRPWPTTHEKIANPKPTHNFIGNKLTTSSANKWIDVHDPATNNLVIRVPESTDEELKDAVKAV